MEQVCRWVRDFAGKGEIAELLTVWTDVEY